MPAEDNKMSCGHDVELVPGCLVCWEEIKRSSRSLMAQGEMLGAREVLWFLMGIVSEMHLKAQTASQSMDLAAAGTGSSLMKSFASQLELLGSLLKDPHYLVASLEEGRQMMREVIAAKERQKADDAEASKILLTDAK